MNGTKPEWMKTGNKVRFIYNVTWECSGEIESCEESGFGWRIAMTNVIINGNAHEKYTFHTLSMKQETAEQENPRRKQQWKVR